VYGIANSIKNAGQRGYAPRGSAKEAKPLQEQDNGENKATASTINRKNKDITVPDMKVRGQPACPEV
jgi:hypothetical protein